MADDNVILSAGTADGATIATDAVTYSGDVGVDVQLTRLVHIDPPGDEDDTRTPIEIVYEEKETVANPIWGFSPVFERDDALSAADADPAEGEWAAVRASGRGALWTTVDGSVDVTQATANDLKCDANVQQGDADVATGNALFVQAGTGATFPGTEYTEDVAIPTPAVGVAFLAERDTILGTTSMADGDWSRLRCDNYGALWAQLRGSLPDTATGNLNSIDLNCGTIVTNTSTLSTGTYSGDSSMNRHYAVGAVYDDTTPGTVTENRTHSLRMSPERYLYTEIRDAGGNERGMVVDASGYITSNVNGTVTVDCNGSNVTVDNASIEVTSGAAFTVQEDGAALTALQLIDNSSATISATDVTRVAIFDDSDAQITSFGGTEYTHDVAAPADPVGPTSMMMRDDTLDGLGGDPVSEGDWVHQRCSFEGGLWVSIDGQSGTLPDTGDSDLNTTAINTGTIAGDTTSIDTQVTAINAKDVMLGTDFSDVFGTSDLTSSVLATELLRTYSVNVVNNAGTYELVPGNQTDGMKVDLGADNDVIVTGDVEVVQPTAADLNCTEANSTAILADTGSIDTFTQANNIALGFIRTATETTETNTDYGTVVGNGTNTGALRVTMASDSTGQVVLTGDLPDTSASDLAGTHTATTSIAEAVYVDDADWVDSTSKHVLVGGVYDGSNSITSGDVGPIAVDADGNVKVDIAADSLFGLTVTLSGNGTLPDTSGGDLSAINSNTSNIYSDTTNILTDTNSIASNTSSTATNTGTIATNTGTIATNTTGLNNCVDGSEMQVDVVTMPGTAAEGAALPSSFVVIAGDDGTDTHAIQTDLNGNVKVNGPSTDGSGASAGVLEVGGKHQSTLPTHSTGDASTLRLTSKGELITNKQTQSVQYGDERLEVKHFNVVATADDTLVIAAPAASKHITVLSMTVIPLSSTVSNIYFETATGGTDCFATSANPMPVAMDADGDNHGGFVLNHNPHGWFETADDADAMQVRMSSGQAMIILGTYIEPT